MFQLPLLLLVVSALDLAAGAPDFKGKPAPVVTTKDGRLVGKYVLTRGERVVMAFLGIPFAKPPVGELRFEPPQPVEPWSHERLAVVQPRPCTQTIVPYSSEDCLFLNVYTPDIDYRPLLPVIVFFHGSTFEFGSTEGYEGTYLLDEDIVYVSVQYRLGLFGYLSTGDEVVPGNMALKDMRLGLRWVRENIRNFGGDPDKVTIAGESVGAAAVRLLMAFAAHEGLFRAAISSSGSGLDGYTLRPPVEVSRMVEVLATLSGCPPHHDEFVKCLKAMPAEDIVNLYTIEYKNLMYEGTEFILSQFLNLIGAVVEPECVEDRIITWNPWHFNTSTPWLVSVNSKEALFYFIPALDDKSDALFLTLNTVFDNYFPLFLNYQSSSANGSLVPSAVREFYLDNRPISRLTLAPFIDLISDANFIYGTYEALLRNKEKSYLYYLDYVMANEIFPVPQDSRIGASHTDDLLFFFPHPFSRYQYPEIVTEEDYQLSRKLIKIWVNFATCLDPTPSSDCSVDFEPFLPNARFLNITQTSMEVDSHFLQDRIKFWQSQPFPFRDDGDYHVPCRPRTTNSTESRFQ